MSTTRAIDSSEQNARNGKYSEMYRCPFTWMSRFRFDRELKCLAVLFCLPWDWATRRPATFSRSELLTLPSWSRASLYALELSRRKTGVISAMTGNGASAARASRQSRANMATAMPAIVRRLTRPCTMPCWRNFDRESMSTVIRVSRLPALSFS